jgi:hypothetical protein
VPTANAVAVNGLEPGVLPPFQDLDGHETSAAGTTTSELPRHDLNTSRMRP